MSTLFLQNLLPYLQQKKQCRYTCTIFFNLGIEYLIVNHNVDQIVISEYVEFCLGVGLYKTLPHPWFHYYNKSVFVLYHCIDVISGCENDWPYDKPQITIV